MSSEKEKQARARALVILQVQSGQKTATDAAAELGVSRQAFHQWEKRGMAAMLESLEEKPAGRPSKEVDPERWKLEEKVRELEYKLAVTEQIADLRGSLLRTLEEEKAEQITDSLIKKKKPGSAKSSSEPNA